jgi:hypothetical protein
LLLLQDVPPSLTFLKLDWAGPGLLSSSTAPSLAQLTALQHFKVMEGRTESQVCPSILQHMQQLRYLDMFGL